MFKAILTEIFGMFATIIIFVASLMLWDWKSAVAFALSTFFVFSVFAFHLLLKDDTWMGRLIMYGFLLLPIPIACFFSILWLPFSIGTAFFSTATCLLAGIILSGTALFILLAKGKISKLWLVIPTMALAYECLPINIPAPFAIDDMLADAGGFVAMLLAAVNMTIVRFQPARNEKTYDGGETKQLAE